MNSDLSNASIDALDFDDCADHITRSVCLATVHTVAHVEPSWTPKFEAFVPQSSMRAPCVPGHVDLASTSFYMNGSLKALLHRLEASFGDLRINWEASPDRQLGFECKAVSLMAVVEFETNVFEDGSGKHVVELNRMSGCRFAFRKLADSIAAELGVTFLGGASKLSHCPPAGEIPEVGVSRKAACAGLLPRLSLKAREADKLQSCRAFGALALTSEDLASTEALRAATAILEIASSPSESEEVRVVAMAAALRFAAGCRDAAWQRRACEVFGLASEDPSSFVRFQSESYRASHHRPVRAH